MRASGLGFLLLVLAVSCGRDAPVLGLGAGGPDGGGALPDLGIVVGPDTGPPLRDGGPPPPDMGPRVDSGTGAPDGGPPPPPPTDGGRPDTGPPPPPNDGGLPGDLGTAPPDAGPPPPLDGGAPDASGPADAGAPDASSSPDAGPVLCPGDTCADAIRLRGRVGLETVTGNTGCAANTTQASCGGAGASDVVLALPVTERRRVVARTASVQGGFLSALSLRDRCGASSSERVCDVGSASGLAAVDAFVDPGTHYLWLDGARAGQSGSYRVDVEIDPQDTCADPIPVTLPALGSSVDVRGDTRGASDTFQASCAGQARSPDHVIALRVLTRARVVIETLGVPGVGRYDTALHLRRACTSGVATTELACDDDGGAGTLSRLDETLDAGTYHLVVDGFSGSASGPYLVRVSHLAAPTPIRFPVPTDTFSTASSGAFGASGDSVTGSRASGPVSAADIDVDLRLARNGLRCGLIAFNVSVDGRRVGLVRFSRGDTRAQASFRNVGARRPYQLEYEVQVAPPSRCGNVTLDTTDSTVTLR